MKSDDFQRFELLPRVKKANQNPENLKERLRAGDPPYKILDLSEDVIEEFYQAACLLLGDKKYEAAANAFLFLTGLSGQQYDFWIGLGMSEQLCHQYEIAIDAYEIAAVCNLLSPVPYFYLAKCLFAIHDRQSSLEALKLAIEIAGEEEEYSDLKEQAEIAKRALEAM